VFESAVGFFVVVFVLSFVIAKDQEVFLQVCMRQKNAGAVWAFIQFVAVSFLRHNFA
jgi:hypothetical protein